MKRCIGLIVIFFGITFVSAQSSDDKAKQAQNQLDSLIKLVEQPAPIQWNRYETTNFEILSIDDAQGKLLYNNIEYIKTWISWRWGIKDNSFSVKCKIMVVPSKDLFVKIFNKDRSSFRYEPKGSAIWICTEEVRWLTDVLPKMMTEVNLNEFEAKFNTKFGLWAHRGMSILNGNLIEIRGALSLGGDLILSKVMLNTTTEQYLKLSEANRIKFDSQCAAFCLMIRKEHGNGKFLDYLGASRDDPEKALSIFSLNNYTSLDSLFFGYLGGLSKEIQQQKVPNSYLTW